MVPSARMFIEINFLKQNKLLIWFFFIRKKEQFKQSAGVLKLIKIHIIHVSPSLASADIEDGSWGLFPPSPPTSEKSDLLNSHIQKYQASGS